MFKAIVRFYYVIICKQITGHVKLSEVVPGYEFDIRNKFVVTNGKKMPQIGMESKSSTCMIPGGI